MLGFFKKRHIIYWTKKCATSEYYSVVNGFDRLEKARCLGRLEAYKNVLHWMGVSDNEVENMRKSVKIN